ncbi:transposase [Sorangium sp. So ce134]
MAKARTSRGWGLQDAYVGPGLGPCLPRGCDPSSRSPKIPGKAPDRNGSPPQIRSDGSHRFAPAGQFPLRRVSAPVLERPAGTAIEACAALALRGGTFAKLDRKGAALEADDAGEARFEPKRRGPFATDLDGFNVQAAVRIEANDDERRERLCRYCARPSFALDRISQLSDGRIAYRLKYPTRGATHRIMTPVEFIARLAALIPPPRYPLVRYGGVLAPHSKWRSAVIPRVPSIQRKDDSEATHGSGGKDSTRCGTAEHGTPNQLAAEGQPSKKRSPAPGTRCAAGVVRDGVWTSSAWCRQYCTAE